MNVITRSICLATILSTCATAGDPQRPRFEILAVSLNDQPIAPTASLDVAEGDVVWLVVYMSSWSPNGEWLKAWHIGMQPTPFDLTPAEPYGFQRVTAYIFSQASCYIYYGLAEAPQTIPPFRFGSTVINSSQAPCQSPDCNAEPCGAFPQLQCRDDLYRNCLAGIAIEILPGACSRHELTIDPNHVWLIDEFSQLIGDINGDSMYDENELEIHPAILRFPGRSECRFSTDQSRAELNCAIDARQPTDPEGSLSKGWDTLQVAADCPNCWGNSNLTQPPSAWESHKPPLEDMNTIVEVESHGSLLDFILHRPITTGEWTCIAHTTHGGCRGHLPGDVDSSGTVEPEDLETLQKCLDNCEDYQCDIDRSGACTAADLLRWVDLAHGAGQYTPWLGTEIAAGLPCPSEN